MSVPTDVSRRLTELFEGSDRELAQLLMTGAKLHDGSVPDARCLRCAVVASQGSLDRLAYYLDLLAVDYRDVIVAGEYTEIAGELVRIRDLGQPL